MFFNSQINPIHNKKSRNPEIFGLDISTKFIKKYFLCYVANTYPFRMKQGSFVTYVASKILIQKVWNS